ncbi:uncharacterized protein LOC107759915 [Nicotiana tabacum]|uniref:Uncharacterized protein LOC107759915 n=2 Tax=Nicotiana TaxID=4085 RepID=A0A1S3X0B5_TOBAC|nr:PREDICTED: uncharacterized protein LOC104227067 [Nicotiana sylvestris]XP_016433405.1 PREDICTED: uncharacterized protein LOC107759915 [Nicotiana tabacum]
MTHVVSSVSIYYSKMKDLWDEVDYIMTIPSYCDKSKDFVTHLRRQRRFQFLMGLNDGYCQSRRQILMISPIPSVKQAYALVVQGESQKLVAGGAYNPNDHMEPTALFTGRNGL